MKIRSNSPSWISSMLFFVGRMLGLERSVLPQIAEVGFAIRAILTGTIAETFGIEMSILTIGGLTVLSEFVILLRMKKVG
ncbi:hypothetical protein MM236_07565 [Belliella sp. DSM 107340]|uniref:Uncharacterized protein n=1 Tax=Belliella calami TaxID=2923436 RepID=A0ABS9UNU8_9BACT|nr:hypothetical protein [Belliella calami]MCH7397840.1 hypothetical protein [Belliella calami]